VDVGAFSDTRIANQASEQGGGIISWLKEIDERICKALLDKDFMTGEECSKPKLNETNNKLLRLNGNLINWMTILTNAVRDVEHRVEEVDDQLVTLNKTAKDMNANLGRVVARLDKLVQISERNELEFGNIHQILDYANWQRGRMSKGNE